MKSVSFIWKFTRRVGTILRPLLLQGPHWGTRVGTKTQAVQSTVCHAYVTQPI